MMHNEKPKISRSKIIDEFVFLLKEGKSKNDIFMYYLANYEKRSEVTLLKYLDEALQKIEKERQKEKAEKEKSENVVFNREDILRILSQIGSGKEREVVGEILIPSDAERIRALQAISTMQGYDVPVDERNVDDLILHLRDSTIDKHYRFFCKKENILISEGGSRSGKTNNMMRYFVLRNLIGKYNVNIIAPSYKMLNLGSFIDIKEFIQENNIDCFVPTTAQGQIKFPSGGVITFEVVTDENEAKRNRDNVFINEADGVPEGVADLIILRAKGKIFIDNNPTRKFWSEKYKKEDGSNVQHSDFRDNPFISDSQKSWFERLEKVGKDAELGSPERYAYEVYFLGRHSALARTVFTAGDFKHWETLPDSFDYVISYADPSLGVGADYFAAGLFGIKENQVYLIDSVFNQYEVAESYQKTMQGWDHLYPGIEHFIEINGIGKSVYNKIANTYTGIMHAINNADSKHGDIVLYAPEAKQILFDDSKTTKEIIKQCITYPDGEHDDAPDLICRASKIIQRHFVY